MFSVPCCWDPLPVPEASCLLGVMVCYGVGYVSLCGSGVTQHSYIFILYPQQGGYNPGGFAEPAEMWTLKSWLNTEALGSYTKLLLLCSVFEVGNGLARA